MWAKSLILIFFLVGCSQPQTLSVAHQYRVRSIYEEHLLKSPQIVSIPDRIPNPDPLAEKPKDEPEPREPENNWWWFPH